MDQNTSSVLIGIIAIGIGIYMYYNKQVKIHNLKEEYQKALKGKNKKRALEAGRNYYSALRGKSTLTIYDEQAIANDLSAMDDAKKEA